MVYFSFFLCFVQTIDNRIFPLFDVDFGTHDMRSESDITTGIEYTSFDLKKGKLKLGEEQRGKRTFLSL
jgi:hypothetical protein